MIYILIFLNWIILPFLFYKPARNSKKISNIILGYSIFMIFLSGAYFSGLIPALIGSEFNYKNVPSPIKDHITFFIEEAKKRNVDVSKIENLKIKYLDLEFNTSRFAGACNPQENLMILPQKEISRLVVVHELGHCILGYKHYLSEDKAHEIMYYSSEPNQSLDKESLDRFFYQSPNSSLIAENTEMALKVILNPFFILYYFSL